MFRLARLQLTLLYSLILLGLFYSFSLGVYLWMNHCFGDGVRKDHDHLFKSQIYQSEAPDSPDDTVMDELRNVLMVSDIILLVGIPILTWILTGQTLSPVQKAHEREKQFLTDASHDLRTPLSILNAEIELTLRKERTKEEYKKSLQSNKEEVNGLISLVENMLFFARENAAGVHKEFVDLTDILAEKVALFQKTAEQKKLSLSFIPPEESCLMVGNQQLLQRLFTGLLDNAIKYTKKGGKVAITLAQNDINISVTITDSGIGIPVEKQEKIFDRFYRAQNSRTEKGYGLGLAIAKEIVELHQGKIHLSSHTGKGTSVVVTFPKKS